MSAADVELGGPSAPRWSATRLKVVLAGLQARVDAISARLRASGSRLLEADEGSLAAWAAAFAAAPQAVPNLPRPPNKRLMRMTVGAVVAAHVALVLVLWLRSSPPPAPPGEMTVELVREEPEKPKPEAKPAAKPEQAPPQRPVQDGKDAGAKDRSTQQAKPEEQKAKPQQQAKQEKAEQSKPEQPKEQQKPEPKPKAERQARHQRQAHRAPSPKGQQQQQAQSEPKQAQEQQQQQQPSPDQVRQEQQVAMPAVALPGASDTGADAVSYSQLVLSQVAKAKKQGRYMGVPGYAGVRFRVAEDGSLEMVKLVVSSGDPTLDIEAEAMIRRAAPFPKPPPGGRRDYGITLVFAAQPE